MLSLGLDISSLSTGVLLLEDGVPEFQGTWKPPAELDYLGRGSWQAEQMMALLENHQPNQICIESYSLGSPNRMEPLITVGTILRYFLRQMGYDWQEVAPTQVKKYAGAALKQDLKLAVFKRWQFEHRSDDVVDAYVLAQIGRGVWASKHGHPQQLDLIRPQQEVIEVLLHPKPKKKAKKEASE